MTQDAVIEHTEQTESIHTEWMRRGAASDVNDWTSINSIANTTAYGWLSAVMKGTLEQLTLMHEQLAYSCV